MHCRLILIAGCLACLVLAGCGGGRIAHVVEATGPDDPARATKPPSVSAANAAQLADRRTPATPPAINTPPDFPPNYRTRVAAFLAVEYLQDGRGPPEITDLTDQIGLLGARTSVCVQYPDNRGPPSYTGMRKIRISGHRDVMSLGEVQFNAKKLNIFETCPGEMKPFIELQQVAQKLKECQARDERRCVVNVEPNRRDVLMLPPPPGTGRNAPAARPD